MIELQHLTKRFGDKVAVDDLSLTIRPGVITGFLGPNGAGKSTTIRMIIGLDNPTSGRVLIDGRPYADHASPLRTIGTLTDARAAQGGRSAYYHLRALAASNGIPTRRVHEVLDIVGLGDVARKRIKGFSLGMGQRVGIAAALLGDPGTVILDEPVNGLDPEGILWIRNLMKNLAREGRTVFVSSHLMSEMALTAEHLVIIGRGRLMVDMAMSDFITEHAESSVLVHSPEATRLTGLLEQAGGAVAPDDDGRLVVRDLDATAIGDVAARASVTLHQLATRSSSLEQVFMGMTHEAVEYQATADIHAVEGTAA
jgi:ABC-2 type transport system ATP-binding protein